MRSEASIQRDTEQKLLDKGSATNKPTFARGNRIYTAKDKATSEKKHTYVQHMHSNGRMFSNNVWLVYSALTPTDKRQRSKHDNTNNKCTHTH